MAESSQAQRCWHLINRLKFKGKQYALRKAADACTCQNACPGTEICQALGRAQKQVLAVGM